MKQKVVMLNIAQYNKMNNLKKFFYDLFQNIEYVILPILFIFLIIGLIVTHGFKYPTNDPIVSGTNELICKINGSTITIGNKTYKIDGANEKK